MITTHSTRTISLYLLCFVACLLALRSYSYGQTVDPATFFPHATGNQWHFRDFMNNSYISDEWVDHDSADAHGGWWVYYVQKFGTNPNPPLLMYIDSNLDVYERYSFSDTNPQLRYRLNAKVGDTWDVDPSNTTYKAEVIGLTRGVVFGKVVTIMQIEFYARFVGGEQWLYVHFLASGIGLFRIDSHPYGRYVLTGATIDGKSFGDLASTDINDPDRQEPALLKVFPNPSSSGSSLTYQIDRQQRIRISIYDAMGSELRTILDRDIEPGTYQVAIPTEELAPGSYTVRILGATRSDSRRLNVVR